MKPKMIDTSREPPPDVCDRSLLDLKRVYVECQPVFFNVLAKLSRDGFVTPPADAFDHINEFLVSQWAGISQRFDPEKGSLKGYVYRSFLQFARRRIARQQRWSHGLASIGDLARIEAPSKDALDTAIEKEDEAFVASFLQQLPELHRQIFLEYTQSSAADERTLAKTHGLSRYRVRELLIESIGRISVAFGHQEQFPADHWDILHSLWSDLLTPAETASRFGLTAEVVREIRDRHGTRLLSNLRALRTKSFSSHREQSMDTSNDEFVKQVFLSPGEDALLESLRDRYGEITQFLSLEDVTFTDEELVTLQENPEWVAKIYETFGGNTELSEEEKEVESAIGLASVEDDLAITDAVLNHLLPALPESLLDWSNRFAADADLERATDEWNHFLEETSLSREQVDEFPFLHELLSVGLTPLAIFDGIHAISQLAERLIKVPIEFKGDAKIEIPFAKLVDSLIEQREQGTQREIQIQLTDESLAGIVSPCIPSGMVVKEIAQYIECSEKRAQSLLRWIVDCAQCTPKLFLGFDTEIAGKDGIKLTPEENQADEKETDLYVRLTPRPRKTESPETLSGASWG